MAEILAQQPEGSPAPIGPTCDCPSLYVTYLRSKLEDKFTVILHGNSTPLEGEILKSQESKDLITAYIADKMAGNADNWYRSTIKVTPDMMPYSPVTWFTTKTQTL